MSNEKYTPPGGDPVDISEFVLGPRYTSEDMYRDIGIEREKDSVIFTDAIQSVKYSTME